MKTEQYQVVGMHCASCAVNIESALAEAAGVEKATVNYGAEKASVTFDESKLSPEKIEAVVAALGYRLVSPDSGHDMHAAKDAELASMKKRLFIVLPLVAASFAMVFFDLSVRFAGVSEMSGGMKTFLGYFMPAAAVVTMVLLGRPYLSGITRFARTRVADMDALVGIGTSVALLYSFAVTLFPIALARYLDTSTNYFDATIVVLGFIALGKYLELRSRRKTGAAVEALLGLQAKTVRVRRDGVEIDVPAESVARDEFIVVRPAERIAVDGIVVEGESYVDESAITGEPMPEHKAIESKVASGTLNTTGSFVFRATAVGGETTLARIIKMVEDAEGSRAPIQALADRVAAIFVPTVLFTSLLVVLTWLSLAFFGLPFSSGASHAVVALVAMLVIACPCALGLATPTAIIVGVGRAARSGILVKDAAALQRLHEADVIVLDKTGTITKGAPEVVAFVALAELGENACLALIAALEARSEHPLAAALNDYAAARGIKGGRIDDFLAVRGRGVRGSVDGVHYFVGSPAALRELGIAFEEPATALAGTLVVLADEKRPLAYALIADAIKDDAVVAITRLKSLGKEVVILSGDDERVVKVVAGEVGADRAVGGVLPEGKLEVIREYQGQGRVVAMVGDGINDAPALAAADIGIAMATGTDVAIEAAGITLLHGDIEKLVTAVALSRATMRTIKQNLFWAFSYNTIGIPLAAGVLYPVMGVMLSPVVAGLAMSLSSVSVVTNSLRLRSRKLT